MPGPGCHAELRFYGELEDFLPEPQRGGGVRVPVDRARSAKDAMESVGVPHPEVARVRIDDREASLDDLLRGGERVEAWPSREPLADPRFVADGHLNKLARHLRMAGFDTLCEIPWDDDTIVAAAAREGRTILTRDKAMLRRRDVRRGYFVRHVESERQLREVAEAMQLGPRFAPFTRCRECNTPLQAAAPGDVAGRVPPRIRALYDQYRYCAGCGRVYWEGSHYDRMRELLARLRASSS